VGIPHTNGNHSEAGAEDEPPSKRRRVSTGASLPKAKPESPPWKKIEADGPSSFTQGGVRKSGRVNRIPLELQPPSDKRQTRGAVQKTYSDKSKNGQANGHHLPFQAQDIPATTVNGTKRPGTSGPNISHQQPKPLPTKASSPKRSYRKSMPSEQTVTPVRSYKKSSTPKNPQSAPSQAQSKTRRLGRSGEIVENEEQTDPPPTKDAEPTPQSPITKLPRIKFRVKPATIPLTHPGLVLPRLRQYNTLREFLDHSQSVHVNDGGLFHPEEPYEYTSTQVVEDAETILRAEVAAEPGGILAPGVSSVYQPEEAESMPPQYAHSDHMNRAAIEFRRLMFIEQRKHRTTAKRLAEACRDEWYRRQPKSLEQLEAEEYRACQLRYKTLVKTLQSTWDNVRAEVNRRRVIEWEAQEQARVRQALSEAVDVSQQKLQARRAHMDSDMPTEDESDGESDPDTNARSDKSSTSDEDMEDRESNMSSESDAEDDQAHLDEVDDENLTVEQLKAKYASLPDIPTETSDVEMTNGDTESIMDLQTGQDDRLDDGSDESVDMDDDMGSSDEGQDSDDDDDESMDDEDDEGGLHELFAPSELRGIELGTVVPHDNDDDDVAEDDEMQSLPNLDGNIEGETSDEHPTRNDEKEHGISAEPSIETDAVTQAKPTDGLDVAVTSPDRSSQPTPRTTETRPSEVDSASSVDLHHSSRQATEEATPQPSARTRTPVPFLLRGTLREYQHDGLDWLANLYANNTNGILADEMGLGKTIQTIALLAHLACVHEVWGPHLVIVPTSVILNWEMEFKKWCPGFKILSYYGTQDERRKKRLGWQSEDSWNVCITSYQIVLQDQQVFKRRKWHYMILDEAHNIKNFNSKRWQTMLTFNTRARLLLTGTPLQNNLTELWSLLYFLEPQEATSQGVAGFANLDVFQEWFKKPSEQILEHGRDQMDEEAKTIIVKLHELLRPYLLRRMKSEVEKQMPAKIEHVEFCRLSKRQRELYDGFLSRDETKGTLASGNYLSIINCLMQLRKVCNHPDLFVDRPIMTSFPMEKPAIAEFEIKELVVRRRLLREDPMRKASLEFLNMIPTMHEPLDNVIASRSATLSAQRFLMDMREAQRLRAQNAFTSLDPSTAKSNVVYLESASRWGRFEELQHCVYLNALRRQQRPIYGKRLLKLVTLDIGPIKPRPSNRKKLLTWLETRSPTMSSMIPTLQSRSQSLKTTIQKFACVTPPVIARDMTSLILTPKGVNTVQSTVDHSTVDPFHESRMRLSIQFPDRRLLQYDCGKLQTLDKLLRKLQAGGHRALIFTQMTKVLDILEQFLNIHGHKYLRLDGATKIEQRQILTDRFNNDTRILAFILSTRSGGLGINLTGADTVIFYDLDWNPAMDKQCQDRCHRIGQTRDVHIYRLVSEHTIEANILKKANQKQMLDDVVIQEGEFTTDYFNKISVRDVLGEDSSLLDADAAADAAMDRVLGAPVNNREVQRVLAQAEDQEDVAAARVAEREIQDDAADFEENAITTTSATPAGPGTPLETAAATPAAERGSLTEDVTEAVDNDELNAWGEPVASTDDYMLKFMLAQLKDTPVELPKDKSKSKRGRDHRSHRAR
jgi:helicase SWR1